MTMLKFEITCRDCDADVEVVATGSKRHWQQAAVVECVQCPWRGIVNVDLSNADAEPTKGPRPRNPDGSFVISECGSDAGYYRHRDAGEPACDACKRAHSKAVTDWNRRNKPRSTGRTYASWRYGSPDNPQREELKTA